MSEYKPFYNTGNYYGYPKCCIDNFVHNFPLHFKQRPEEQQKTAKNGFIPCSNHANQILAGKIKIEDVILPTRKESRPFSRQK